MSLGSNIGAATVAKEILADIERFIQKYPAAKDALDELKGELNQIIQAAEEGWW